MTFTPRYPSVRRFGQKVSLWPRISKIMRDYKEGISIFSELIQNADDAGAEQLEIVVDWRVHVDEQDMFAGPALLVFNDAPFTPEDFEGIQKIDEGGKSGNLRKTGRFGVGFNTIYNLTDYPSILAGSYLSWLDPHLHYAEDAGDQWALKDVTHSSFMQAYTVGHFEQGCTDFPYTLFRFPFRTPAQVQKNKDKKHWCPPAVTREVNISPLLQNLEVEGENLLVFLKSILEIKVREIEEDGTETVRLHIRTLNQDEVSDAHAAMLTYPDSQEELNKLCEADPTALPTVSYRHTIQTQTPTETIQSTWRVAHRIGVNPKGQLIKVMKQLQTLQEKAVPWGGAAARIESDRPEPVQGRQFCFLPLPKTTGLPIHIHGYWDLDSSRRSSTDEEGTGNAKARSDWNRLLATEVVAIACADLIRDLVADVGHRDPSQFYDLWPLGHADGVTDFRVPFLKAVHQHPVIHSNLRDEWMKPDDIRALPPQGQALFEPLTADRVRMASGFVPDFINRAFQDVGHPFKKITPKETRKYLRKIDKPMGLPIAEIEQESLRRPEWVVELWKFCLSDGHRHLMGLPLALLQDGTLHRFGEGLDGWIYRANFLQQQIFAQFPHWFLALDIQQVLPHEPVAGATEFTVNLVAERLAGLDWWQEAPQGTGYLWEPMGEGKDLPNKKWLSLVYQYLTTESSPLPIASLKEVPVVPGIDGYLHKGGFTDTPLWPEKNIAQKRQDALNYFGIPIIATDAIPQARFTDLFNRHPAGYNGLIFKLSPLDVIDTLTTYTERNTLPPYDVAQYKELLNYISSSALDQLKQDPVRKEQLKQIPIFPTIDGELVVLEHEDYKVGIPEAELPLFDVSIKLLEPTWKYLFEILGVKRLSLAVLIEEHLLPAYGQWKQAQQLEMLAWLQSAFPAALKDLSKRGSGDQRLRDAVKNTPLIRCTDGELRSAQQTYQPNARYVIEVLGGDAPVPDMQNVYNQAPGDWLALFQLMGIRDKLQAQDLLDHIKRLQAKLRATSMVAVTESCLRLLKYVEENWLQLQQQKVTLGQSQMDFAAAIRNVQWLPVVVDPHVLAQYPGAEQPQTRLYRSEEVLCREDINIGASQGFMLLPRKTLPANIQTPKGSKVEVAKEMGFKRPTFEQAMTHLEELIKIWGSGPRPNLDDFNTAVLRVYRYLNQFLNLPKQAEYKRDLEFRFQLKECIWDEKGRFWYPRHVFTKKTTALFGSYRLNKGSSNLFLAFGQRQGVRWEDCYEFLENVVRAHPQALTEKSDDLQCVLNTLKHMTALLRKQEMRTPQLNYILTENNRLLPPNKVWIPDVQRYEDPVRRHGQVSLLHPEVDQGLASAVGCNSLKGAKEAKGGQMPLSREPDAQPQAKRWQAQLRTPQFREGLERLLLHEGKILPTAAPDLSWLDRFQVKIAARITTNLYWGISKLIAKDVEVNYYCDRQGGVIYVLYAPSVDSEFLGECVNDLLREYSLGLNNEVGLNSILQKDPSEIHSYLDQKGVQNLLHRTEAPEEELDDAEPIYFGSGSEEAPERDDEETKDPSPQQQPQQPSPPRPPGRRSILDTPSSEKEEEKTIETQEDPRPDPAADREELEDTGSLFDTGSGVQHEGTSRRRTRGTKKPEDYSRTDLQPTPSDFQSPNVTSTGQKVVGVKPQPTRDPSNTTQHASTKIQGQTRVTAGKDREAGDPERLTQEKRRETGDRGVEIVLEYEKKQGRSAIAMDQLWYNNPGYDVQSRQDEPDPNSRWYKSTDETDGSVRYIEVKSFKGAWPQGGARLSRRQFWFGLEQGEEFWLYVVEHVGTPGKHKIYCILNAAQEVKSFYFDPGWREMAQTFGEVWE